MPHVSTFLVLRELWREIAGQMTLQVGLDLRPLSVGAIVGVARDPIADDLEGRVVALLRLRKLLRIRLFGLVGEVGRSELGRIEIETASLRARRRPGHGNRSRQRILIAYRSRHVPGRRGTGGQAACAVAAARQHSLRKAATGHSPESVRESVHRLPNSRASVPRTCARSTASWLENMDKTGSTGLRRAYDVLMHRPARFNASALSSPCRCRRARAGTCGPTRRRA